MAHRVEGKETGHGRPSLKRLNFSKSLMEDILVIFCDCLMEALIRQAVEIALICLGMPAETHGSGL
ncbi:MAG: hypothetical protein HS127_19420 [Planctomycetia bacterium]|nr:hypothetical protein [Planctomycetia bacterium]